MAKLHYKQSTVDLQPEQTVLDALIQAGHVIPNSCRSGLCHSCIMRCIKGAIPQQAQQGLKSSQVETGHLLACQCHPENDITLQLPTDSTPVIGAKVLEKVELPGRVIRLRLSADLNYQPGQFVNLWRDQRVVRSYSLASVPALEPFLEFHIRLQPQGLFSSWLQEQLQEGDEIRLDGPNGECFYTQDDPQQPLLLAGIGTGMAPLWGIVREALRQGHSGPIYLYTGGRTQNSLYLHPEIEALASEHQNLHYRVSLLESKGNGLSATIDQLINQDHIQLSGFRAFLCGSPERVNKLRKLCFIKGISMQAISCDLFKPAA